MKLLVLLVGVTLSLNVLADRYWSKLSIHAKSVNVTNQFQLNIEQLKQDLEQVNESSQIIITLPRTDGRLSQFIIWETSVIAEDLAIKYPNYKTYKIKHIETSEVYGRLELMNDKLSVIIKTPIGHELIKISDQWSQIYQSKNKSSIIGNTFSCGTLPTNSSQSLSMKLPLANQYRASVNKLTKLRVAIASTVEYSAKFGNTKPLVLAEIITAVNRINEVFESELSITLELIGNNEDIIFIGSDSFSNTDASSLIGEVQTVIGNLIGNSNYDLGHVFSTGGGGLASLGSVCISNAKAQGVTGNSNPTSDSFWIDFVAHEMGHQLGAEHTFNGSSGSCFGSTRVASSAYEPGSGSTIMAYAGICSGENIQSNSDDSFHSKSIFEINNSIPVNCGVDVFYSSIHSGMFNSNNPIITSGLDYQIPTNTAFVLTTDASDLDGDDQFYQWDGADKGTVTTSDNIGCDLKDNALFRSNKPIQENKRYFPSIETLLNKKSYFGETLPTTNRNINFTVKVTDNKGGFATDDIILTSNTSSNNFKVTSQSTTNSFTVNDPVTVKWNVAKTSSVPINCGTVDIQLLSFSADKSTFTAQSLTPSGEINSGSAVIKLPSDGNSSSSRFLVKCKDNVFFAINDADFTISGGLTSASNTETKSSGGVEISSISEVSNLLECPYEVEEDTNSSSSGSGSLPLTFLALMTGLFLARRYA